MYDPVWENLRATLASIGLFDAVELSVDERPLSFGTAGVLIWGLEWEPEARLGRVEYQYYHAVVRIMLRPKRIGPTATTSFLGSCIDAVYDALERNTFNGLLIFGPRNIEAISAFEMEGAINAVDLHWTGTRRVGVPNPYAISVDLGGTWVSATEFQSEGTAQTSFGSATNATTFQYSFEESVSQNMSFDSAGTVYATTIVANSLGTSTYVDAEKNLATFGHWDTPKIDFSADYGTVLSTFAVTQYGATYQYATAVPNRGTAYTYQAIEFDSGTGIAYATTILYGATVVSTISEVDPYASVAQFSQSARWGTENATITIYSTVVQGAATDVYVNVYATSYSTYWYESTGVWIDDNKFLIHYGTVHYHDDPPDTYPSTYANPATHSFSQATGPWVQSGSVVTATLYSTVYMLGDTFHHENIWSTVVTGGGGGGNCGTIEEYVGTYIYEGDHLDVATHYATFYRGGEIVGTLAQPIANFATHRSQILQTVTAGGTVYATIVDLSGTVVYELATGGEFDRAFWISEASLSTRTQPNWSRPFGWDDEISFTGDLYATLNNLATLVYNVFKATVFDWHVANKGTHRAATHWSNSTAVIEISDAFGTTRYYALFVAEALAGYYFATINATMYPDTPIVVMSYSGGDRYSNGGFLRDYSSPADQLAESYATVVWSDGRIATNQFISPSGAKHIAIFIFPDGTLYPGTVVAFTIWRSTQTYPASKDKFAFYDNCAISQPEAYEYLTNGDPIPNVEQSYGLVWWNKNSYDYGITISTKTFTLPENYGVMTWLTATGDDTLGNELTGFDLSVGIGTVNTSQGWSTYLGVSHAERYSGTDRSYVNHKWSGGSQYIYTPSGVPFDTGVHFVRHDYIDGTVFAVHMGSNSWPTGTATVVGALPFDSNNIRIIHRVGANVNQLRGSRFALVIWKNPLSLPTVKRINPPLYPMRGTWYATVNATHTPDVPFVLEGTVDSWVPTTYATVAVNGTGVKRAAIEAKLNATEYRVVVIAGNYATWYPGDVVTITLDYMDTPGTHDREVVLQHEDFANPGDATYYNFNSYDSVATYSNFYIHGNHEVGTSFSAATAAATANSSWKWIRFTAVGGTLSGNFGAVFAYKYHGDNQFWGGVLSGCQLGDNDGWWIKYIPNNDNNGWTLSCGTNGSEIFATNGPSGERYDKGAALENSFWVFQKVEMLGSVATVSWRHDSFSYGFVHHQFVVDMGGTLPASFPKARFDDGGGSVLQGRISYLAGYKLPEIPDTVSKA